MLLSGAVRGRETYASAALCATAKRTHPQHCARPQNIHIRNTVHDRRTYASAAPCATGKFQTHSKSLRTSWTFNAICSGTAPCSSKNSRERKPQLTEIRSIPLFLAVSMSTSESPT